MLFKNNKNTSFLSKHNLIKKMNEQINSAMPEIRKISVWTEPTKIVPKETIVPIKTPDTSDDIPTIPDLDDFQDILEKEVSKAPISKQADIETANTLAEVSGGYGGSIEGMDAALNVLRSYVPVVEMDLADNVWTVDSLITQLLEEDRVIDSASLSDR